ncbi:MAG: archaeosortase/exosortase family protein [Candidatus Micrarchaeota archaeon]
MSFTISKKEKHFLLHFTALFFLSFAILKALPLQPLNSLVAFSQDKMLSAAGFSVLRQGPMLVVGSSAFEMVVDCSGLVMTVMFLALLYATKTKIPLRKTLAYMVFFLAFNLLRLSFTLATGAVYGQGVLDVVHPALWFVDSGVVFACWAKEYGLW